MKAVVAHGPRRFELTDMPGPTRPDGGRVLAVEAVGVCAADRMLWHGTGPWEVTWPFVPGHEILGRDVDTGQRLTAEVSVPCGQCVRCRAGRTNLCPHGRHLGSDLPGAFAQFLALPAQAVVHPVPDGLHASAAVLAEPLACAVHALDRAGVTAHDTVAVIGLGTVGALAAHVAVTRGVRRVLALVRNQWKADLAQALGAQPVLVRAGTVAPDADDAADAVIECSGDPAAVGTALRLAAPGGRICLYSVYTGESTVDFNQVAEYKELTVRGGHLAPGCFPEAVELLESVPAELLVTGVHPLSGFADALDHPADHRIKEVLVP